MRSLKNIDNKIQDDFISIKNTVECDKFDLRTFAELKNESPRLKKVHEDMVKTYKPFTELQEDVFNSLFKYNPIKNSESKIEYNYLANSSIIDSVFESDQYKNMRNITRLDSMTSCIATEILSSDLEKLIKEIQNNNPELLEGDPKLQKQADKQKTKYQQMSEDPKSSEGQKEKQRIKYEEAQKKLQEYKDKNKEEFNKTYGKSIVKILQNTDRKIGEMHEDIMNWGLDNEPSFIKTGYQDKIKLLESLQQSSKLKKMVNLLGRFKALAKSSQRDKVKVGINEIFDIETGSDLSKIMSSELMSLKHPLLKLKFKKDYLENNLLQYKHQSKQVKQKGPIVALLDSSGSMSELNESWAKAVILGMYEIAKIQKRDMAVVHFSSGINKDKLHVNFFKKGEYNLDNILDMVEYFEGGGTNFEPPLQRAQEIINTQTEFSKADICMVTDGESCVTNSFLKTFLKWKNSKSIKVQSILIDYSSCSITSLQSFSDSIIKLSNLKSSKSDSLIKNLYSEL